MNVGNNGAGVLHVIPDVGNDGVGIRDVMMGVGNSYMCIYHKLCLGRRVSNTHTETMERTLKT